MDENSFWLSTWRSLYNRIEGFFEHEQERQRLEWERCRLISFYAYRSNPYLKNPPRRATKLFQIPGENEPVKVTKQDLVKTKASFEKWDRKIEQDIELLEKNAVNG